MIKEVLMLMLVVLAVIFFLKIFSKVLKLSTYILVISVLTLLILSFFKPEIKVAFIEKIKGNVEENSARLKEQISGVAILQKDIINKTVSEVVEEKNKK